MSVAPEIARLAEAVLAPESQRATYLAEDLSGLLEPHPEVTRSGGAFGCGGWTARRNGDQLELDGKGTRIDGLRALCAAAWSADGVTRDSARSAIERLEHAG